MANLDSKGEIVLIELPNPEETQIWEGENESVRSRQHIFLQLIRGGSAPWSSHLPYLLYTIFTKKKSIPFLYLLLTNSSPSTYLV